MTGKVLGQVTFEGDPLNVDGVVELTIQPGADCGELFLSIPVGAGSAISQVGEAKVSSTAVRFYGPDNTTSSLSLPYSEDLVDMLGEVEDMAEDFNLTFDT